MDNKQKRKLLKSIYKSLMFFALVSIIWIGYVCIESLIKDKPSILWMDITLLVFALILLVLLFVDVSKTTKMQNKYKLGKTLFLFVTATFLTIIVSGFVYYYMQLTVPLIYFAASGLIAFAEVLTCLNFVIGLKLSKLYQNTTITIDSDSEIPNFDDELLLKKKLDELNRKLEIKKVQERINEIQIEIDKK